MSPKNIYIFQTFIYEIIEIHQLHSLINQFAKSIW